jgi:hypothetical protein
VTDPVIRSSLFGPFAQIDHHHHYGSGYDGRPELIQHDPGCAEVQGSTRRRNGDLVDSAHISSTCSTKDGIGSGEPQSSSPKSRSSSGYAGTDGSGSKSGNCAGHSDTSGSGRAGRISDADYDQMV